MSYILDALRRADAERERGPVPGLHAQPAWTPPIAAGIDRPRAGKRRGEVVGVVLLVAVLGWLGWRALEPAPSSDADSGRRPVADSPIATPAPNAPAVAVAPVAPAAVTLPAAVAEAPAPERPAARPATDKPAARTVRKPATPLASAASSGGKGATTAATASAETSAASPAAAKVYAVADLPEDIRRDLPKLSIGGSIYSESPASRFVIVNGQLLHEGDTVAPGLVLQQIRLKSAVLAFRGYRYNITY